MRCANPDKIRDFWERYEGGTGNGSFICPHHLLIPTIFGTYPRKHIQPPSTPDDALAIKYHLLCAKCDRPFRTDGTEMTRYATRAMLGYQCNTIVFHFGHALLCSECSVIPLWGNHMILAGNAEQALFDPFLTKIWDTRFERIRSGLTPDAFHFRGARLVKRVFVSANENVHNDVDGIKTNVAQVDPMCHTCFKGDAPMRCSECKLARYCDSTCQKKHWKTHKPVCKALAKREGFWFQDHGISKIN